MTHAHPDTAAGRTPIPFPVNVPFAQHLGFQLLVFENGVAEIAVPLQAQLCNSWMVAHGGLSMTLLDAAMAHAARSPVTGPDAQGRVWPEETRGVVTIEMKTSFMRPGKGTLLGRGRMLHRTASMAFCEGSVFDGEGQLVAHATGTFKYFKALPTGGRDVQPHPTQQAPE